MIRNHLLVALRRLRRRPGFAVLNVLGLTAGLAVCLVLALFVRHELSYDRFHEHADRIVQLQRFSPVEGTTPLIPARTATTLEADFPEVERTVRFSTLSTVILHGDEAIVEEKFFYVDPSVFDAFTLPIEREAKGVRVLTRRGVRSEVEGDVDEPAVFHRAASGLAA